MIVPVFNEEDGLDALMARLKPALERITPDYEVVFVDDGSQDATLVRLRDLSAGDQRLRAVSFSRNFGKEIAIAAGLDHARGQAVVIMDADLQHPPEVIEEFVAHWRDGKLMVYGVRRSREGDGPVRRAFTRTFYRIFERFAETGLPEGAGDFRLLDRRIVEVLKAMGERARFSKGLYAWVGFPSAGVPFDVEERAFGTTKWSFRKLFRFAFDGITSFSTVPLKVSTYVGALISLASLATAAYFAVRTFLFGTDLPGFPSLIVSIMFFSGVQLMSLGMIGEYVGRIFAEVKRRPLYVVGERLGFEESLPAIREERRRLG